MEIIRNDKIKTFVSLGQFLFGLIIHLIVFIVFIVTLNAKAEKNKDDIKDLKEGDKEYFYESRSNQIKIIDAINDIKLQLKDKADRKRYSE